MSCDALMQNNRRGQVRRRSMTAGCRREGKKSDESERQAGWSPVCMCLYVGAHRLRILRQSDSKRKHIVDRIEYPAGVKYNFSCIT